MKKPTLNQRLQYIKFLEKRLASKNYKNNVSETEYKKTEEQLKKEKLIVYKFLMELELKASYRRSRVSRRRQPVTNS